MNNQRLLIVAMLIVYIFSPIIFNWIVNPAGNWYRPYIIWVLLIAVAFVLQLQRSRK
ncbi:hypothetical protein [Candidatus Pelagadaptatus aseana]|uniref:hypothetical protein n=1 Tax=Candidatus Pelagadaptatus aseana TaxID=3120508 RepID=UPI003C6F4D51